MRIEVCLKYRPKQCGEIAEAGCWGKGGANFTILPTSLKWADHKVPCLTY